MAVLQMQRMSICALKKDRKAILKELQSMGILEVNSNLSSEEGFEKMDTLGARIEFEKKAQISENGLAVLEIYAPEKRSLLSGLEGKKLIERAAFDKFIEDRESVMASAKQLIELNKSIAENKAGIQKLSNQIEALNPWISLDVPMDYEGTGKTALFLGTLAPDMTEEQIYAAAAQGEPPIEALDVTLISRDKDAVYLSVLCLRKDRKLVEERLRAAGFARPGQPVSKVPAEQKRELEEEIETLKEEILRAEDQIRQMAEDREGLKVVGDYYRMRAERYEVLGKLPQSQRAFVISGYIPAKAGEMVKRAIEGAYDCVVDIEAVGEDEEAPVLLENNAFSESMEGVVESYGMPHKGELDPTTLMSFFYVFFFGMMLSDAAYGAIIAAACFVALKKFPRMQAGMRKTMKMFMFCGISTMVWGVLFGGYFGNVVDVVSQTFFGKTVTIPALWFAPLNDPMKLLVYSLAFGLVHLFAGLGIKGYMLLKDKKYMDFFCDIVLWYALLIGLVLMLVPTDIFASIAGAVIVFPPAVNTLAKGLAIAGAVGILLMSGRASKNPALRLALGAYDIYNITGWLSDVLSYSRLLALGLATGVIASVVNQMGSMFGKSVIGVIGFIVVFIVGHTLNLAINVLGAYVHTNRLQFVEFFGKFYEGGGKPFEPFKSDTKYVDIKEETLK